MLPNKYYDVLKWVVLIFLPASGALYFGLSKIWNFPFAEEVVGTIAVLTTFLGTVLQISSHEYNKELVQEEEE